MKDFSKAANDQTVAAVTKGLEANNITVIVVDTLEQAKAEAIKLVPEGVEVFTGTSVTLDAAGIAEHFNTSGKYIANREKISALGFGPENALERRHIGGASDFTLGSAHAITEDGQVVIASNSGSQLPNYAYGAGQVIWVVGTQKLVKDLPEALERIEKHTLPLENERAQKAYGNPSRLSKLLIYRGDVSQRATVILVKTAVGY
jgi:hypothetical protein